MDILDLSDNELIKELEDRGYVVAEKEMQHVIIRQRSEGKTLALYNHYHPNKYIRNTSFKKIEDLQVEWRKDV